jgi:hypothetical protein
VSVVEVLVVPVVAAVPGVSATAKALAPWFGFEPIAPALVLDWLCVASLLAALPVTPPVVAGVLVDD